MKSHQKIGLVFGLASMLVLYDVGNLLLVVGVFLAIWANNIAFGVGEK